MGQNKNLILNLITWVFIELLITNLPKFSVKDNVMIFAVCQILSVSYNYTIWSQLIEAKWCIYASVI